MAIQPVLRLPAPLLKVAAKPVGRVDEAARASPRTDLFQRKRYR